MTDIYTGPPGNGKSLHVAKTILGKAFWRKRIIVNFEIHMPERYQKVGRQPIFWDNSAVTVKHFKEFAKKNHIWKTNGTIAKESQTLVVIDECYLLFNKMRMKNRGDTDEWIEFFTHHRKWGYDFILVTQHIRMIHEDIREILERETKHFKWDNCPSTKMLYLLTWFICKMFGITLFFYVSEWVHFRSKEFSSRKFFTYRRKFARVYDSYKLFDEEGAKAELRGERTSASEDEHSAALAAAYVAELLEMQMGDRYDLAGFVKPIALQSEETA
jgi:hypothetical protein